MRTESSRTGPPAKRLAVQPGANGPAPAQGSIQGPSLAPTAAESLAGRQFLLLGGSCAQAEGPGVNALAQHLESVGGRVAVRPSVGFRAGRFGSRALDRPDLVVAILPARGSALAA